MRISELTRREAKKAYSNKAMKGFKEIKDE